MKIILPIEISKSRIAEFCLSGMPSNITVLPFYHEKEIQAEQLQEFLKDHRADCFFSFNARKNWNVELVELLNRWVKNTVFWYLEGPSTYFKEVNSLDHLKSFSHGYSISEEVCRHMKENAIDSYFLPCSIPEKLIAIDHKLRQEREDKITFVGIPKGKRISLIQKLLSHGYPIEVIGPDWNKYINPSSVFNDYLWDQGCIDYYRTCKAVINIDEWFPDYDSGLGIRTFEILASGVEVISNPIRELRKIQGMPLTQFNFFHNYNELEKIVCKILSNPAKPLENNADFLSNHTYNQRMKYIFGAGQCNYE